MPTDLHSTQARRPAQHLGISVIESGEQFVIPTNVALTDLTEQSGTHVNVEAGTWTTDYLRAVLEGKTDDYLGPTYESEERSAVLAAAGQALVSYTRWKTSRWKILCDRWDIGPNVTERERRDIMRRDDPLENEVAKRIEAATRLGVSTGDVRLAAHSAWGHPFLVEPDERVDKRTGNQRALRGRATRELEHELAVVIEEAANRAAAKEES
jgi:hypothetical protein